MSARLGAWLGVCALIWLGACGPGPTATTPPPLPGLGKAPPAEGLVMIRRYVDYLGVEPGEALERYARRGSEEKVELLSWKPLNGGQGSGAQTFQRLHELYAGGRGRFVLKLRDFRVRDPGLFVQNYTWQAFTPNGPIAGRPCVGMEVKPRRFDRPWYRLWVDPVTLWPLKYEEFTPEGILAAEMEVLEVREGVDLSLEGFPAAEHSPPIEVPLASLPGLVPFQALLPTYLPEGFELRSSRISQKAGIPVAALSYTDGVQEIFLVEYDEITPSPVANGSQVTVGVSYLGASIDAAFAVLGTQVHVTGKVAEGEIFAVIEGLVPPQL